MTKPAGHEHAFELWTTIHRAPTGPYPEHTAFVVVTCQQAGCGVARVFPESNFLLTTPAFKAKFHTALKAAGWHMDGEEPAVAGNLFGDDDPIVAPEQQS